MKRERRYDKNCNGYKYYHICGSITLPDETDRKFYDTAKASEAVLITGKLKHYPADPLIMLPAAFLEKYVAAENFS